MPLRNKCCSENFENEKFGRLRVKTLKLKRPLEYLVRYQLCSKNDFVLKRDSHETQNLEVKDFLIKKLKKSYVLKKILISPFVIKYLNF